MSLFSKLRNLGAWVRGTRRSTRPSGKGRNLRLCRFEEIEPRVLFAASPIHVGAVYFDPHSGDDSQPNVFTVSFNGGVAGTQLTSLVINTNPNNTAPQEGPFFATQAGPPGVYGNSPATIDWADSTVSAATISAQNGGTLLTITNIQGLTAGGKLVFTVDVDDRKSDGTVDATVNGQEFQGSTLSATFAAAHYHDLTSQAGTFADKFDSQMAGLGLNLPPDSYVPPAATDQEVYTAGTGLALTPQTPLPITVSGTVFEDKNLDNLQQAADPGISGVQLTLYQLDDTGNYVATSNTATTDANGNYTFQNVLPGTYRVMETQPSGYYSVGATAGKVGGTTDGTVTTADVLSSIVLVGGDNSVQNNFAEAKPATLAGHVYYDANNNGQMDPGEKGIGGATLHVTYLGPLGPQTTINIQTAADGSWAATNLLPGNYKVTEDQPAGYLDGKDRAGDAGGTAHNPGDLIDGVYLASGQSGKNYDFGELLPASIAGTVFIDNDGHWKTNPSEPTLQGVTIQLIDPSGTVLGSTTTDAHGNYAFNNLYPGTYTVHELAMAGYVQEDSAVGSVGGIRADVNLLSNVTLAAGTNGTQYNFAVYAPASISGHVVVDADGNCETNPNEPPLAGVTMQLLDPSNNVLSTTQTDASGNYSFNNLKPGMYTVHELPTANYFEEDSHVGSVGDTQTSVDTLSNITLGSGVNGTKYNFCVVAPASLGGYVYVDANNNGLMDSGETPIAGVKLTLLDSSGNPTSQTTTTDAAGHYQFAGLMPGTYGVAETQPSGYYNGKNAAGTAGGTAHEPADTITGAVLMSGTAGQNYNFGELLPASIAGKVVVDNSGNCTEDPTNPPLPGVTIQLLDASGTVVQTATTADDGTYSFVDLQPGTYSVHELPTSGYFEEDSHSGSAGGTTSGADSVNGIALGSGTAGTKYDFCVVAPASVSGHVYLDNNQNQTLDAGDTLLSGVTIYLKDSMDDIVGTTTTDANGYYAFTNLRPGTYTVMETTVDNYIDGPDQVGSVGGLAVPSNQLTSIPLTSGVNGTDYNFSWIAPASISGHVYADSNNNGVRDAGEPGIAGVTVYLLDANGNPTGTVTTTDANGYYAFNHLTPGVYGVEESQPAGYLQGLNTAGTAGGTAQNPQDLITGANLTPGTNGQNYDFGEIVPATLSGYVFEDGPAIVVQQGSLAPDPTTVRNGVLTATDKRLAGVTLQLADGTGVPQVDASGNPITTTTDANGYYQFTNLQPGVYTVIESQPTGYTTSVDTPGSKGGREYVPNRPSDAVVLQELSVVPNTDAIVKIPVGSGDHATSYNFGEVTYTPAGNGYAAPPKAETPIVSPNVLPGLGNPAAPGATYSLPPASVAPLEWLGGGGIPVGDTWHLSIIDGGQPRSATNGSDMAGTPATLFYSTATWAASDLQQGQWILADANGQPVRTLNFGMRNARPITGDWNGDGTTKVGVYVDGQWFLDANGDGTWDDGDLWARLGREVDLPVTGDWDGDGKTDIGIFGPEWTGDERQLAREPGQPTPHNPIKGQFKNIPPDVAEATNGVRTMQRVNSSRARADVIDHVFRYGGDGDVPVAGDWTGCGITTIGVFREGTWYLDCDGDGRWSASDQVVQFGQPGDIPVVGDWTGDGVKKLGIFRHGTFYLDVSGSHKLENAKVVHLGNANDVPVVGDWNGDGVDKVGVYRGGRGPNVPSQAARVNIPSGGATATR